MVYTLIGYYMTCFNWKILKTKMLSNRPYFSLCVNSGNFSSVWFYIRFLDRFLLRMIRASKFCCVFRMVVALISICCYSICCSFICCRWLLLVDSAGALFSHLFIPFFCVECVWNFCNACGEDATHFQPFSPAYGRVYVCLNCLFRVIHETDTNACLHKW